MCALYGKWTECLYSVDPATFDAHRKSDIKRSDRKGSTQVTVEIMITNVDSFYIFM